MKRTQLAGSDVTEYLEQLLTEREHYFPTTGFAERLAKEMTSLIPPNVRAMALELPERKYYVRIGGSILVSLSTFTSQWISKQEYEEHGSGIVHMKCI